MSVDHFIAVLLDSRNLKRALFMDEKNLQVLRDLQKEMEDQKGTNTPTQPPRKPHIPGNGFSEESEQFFRDLAKKKFSESSSSEPLQPRVRITSEDKKIGREIGKTKKRGKKNNAPPKAPISVSPPPEQRLLNSPLLKNDKASPPELSGIPIEKLSTSFSIRGKRGVRDGNAYFRGVPVSLKDYKELREAFDHMIYGNDQKALQKKQNALILYLARSPGDKEARLILEKVNALVAAGPANRFIPVERGKKRETWVSFEQLKSRESNSAQQPSNSASKWIKKICHWCEKEFAIHKDWVSPPNKCKTCTEKLRLTRISKGKGTKASYTSFVIVSGGAPGLGKRH
ncbi:hypothetical protein [Pseudomonas aeruginosa]|uniref:hypothetical protein n=2 Tax=Pseudomonas aeruginosa TaxID=287 RepID=UPI001298691C|nr:hypothetical protein [Pseudomonas aeruginosa]